MTKNQTRNESQLLSPTFALITGRRSDGERSCAEWRRSEQRPGRGRQPGEDHQGDQRQQEHQEDHQQDRPEEQDHRIDKTTKKNIKKNKTTGSTTRSPGRSTRPPRHSGKNFAKIVDNAGGEDNDLKLRAMDGERVGRGNGGKTPFPLMFISYRGRGESLSYSNQTY